jgi:RHS repeat-associated protein
VIIGGTTPLAGTYITSNTYADDGGALTQTDPAEGGLPAETLTTGYDGMNVTGLTSTSGHVVSGITYTHLGQVGQIFQYQGAEVWDTFTWDTGNQRLTESLSQRLATANPTVSDDHYTYTNDGQIMSDKNVTEIAGTDMQCFSYDQLQNLTQAWTPSSNSCAAAPSTATALGGPAPYWTSYSVNPATGNRSTTAEHTLVAGKVSATTTDAYGYPTGVHPHAVASVSHTTGTAMTTDAYAYNADGTSKSLPGQSIGYNAEHRPVTTTLTASGKAQTSVYDADRNLLLQSDPVTGTTAYLGDTQLHIAAGSTAASGNRTYSLLGMPLAERDTTAGVAGSTYSFLHPNPQGTATALVSTTTAAVTRRYEDPFGNPRGASTPWVSNHGFLDAAQNSLTTSSGSGTPAITQLGAREYDPAIGRFLSVDPILEVGDTQAINGYAYANNDPVNSTDPSGLMRQNLADGAPVGNTALDEKARDIQRQADDNNAAAAGWQPAHVHWGSWQDLVGGVVDGIDQLHDVVPSCSVLHLGCASGVTNSVNKGLGADPHSIAYGIGSFVPAVTTGEAGAAEELADGSIDALRAWRATRAERSMNGIGGAAQIGSNLTRVGRWMSKSELDQMQKTSQVVEGGGGRTYVGTTPDPSDYKAGNGYYVEFDVPTDSLRPAGQPNWAQIPGPNVGTTRFGSIPRGMPPATNIQVVQGP